jgi:hypothetical protein
VLEGVASHGLLILFSIITHLEGGYPRKASEVEDLGVTFLRIGRLSRARAFPSLLDLWEGGPRRAPKSIKLLWGRLGWAHRGCLLVDRSGGPVR